MGMQRRLRFKYGELTYSQNVATYFPRWDIPPILDEEEARLVRQLVSTDDDGFCADMGLPLHEGPEPWDLADVTETCFWHGLRATLHDGNGHAYGWVDRDGSVTFFDTAGRGAN